MTLDEYMYQIQIGADVEFAYKGKRYTILAWHKPIVIGEQNTDNEWFYKDANDLLDNFKIEGVSMREFLGEIEILFWC